MSIDIEHAEVRVVLVAPVSRHALLNVVVDGDLEVDICQESQLHGLFEQASLSLVEAYLEKSKYNVRPS